MKRVVVIGSGGSGKSTLSRRLGDATGIEVIHLDSLYWKPNWEKTSAEEWEKVISNLVTRESWIMDGNFGGTLEMRIKAADTVFFLDIARCVCLYRVIKRLIKFRGKNRPDMTEGCNERLDVEFLSWIWNYPGRSRPRVLAQMKEFPNKRFIILRSNLDAENFLRDAQTQAAPR